MPTNSPAEMSKPPDPDSAAVDAIAEIISDWMQSPRLAAKEVIDYLREHPEHGPWPVITAMDCDDRSMEVFVNAHGPAIVIPDPPAEVVSLPTVESIMDKLRDYDALRACDKNSAAKSIGISIRDDIARLVEAANGGRP